MVYWYQRSRLVVPSHPESIKHIKAINPNPRQTTHTSTPPKNQATVVEAMPPRIDQTKSIPTHARQPHCATTIKSHATDPLIQYRRHT